MLCILGWYGEKEHLLLERSAMGLNVPELSTNDDKSTSTFTDAVLVTSTAYVVVDDVVS